MVWGLRLEVRGLKFKVWGSRFRVWGLRFSSLLPDPKAPSTEYLGSWE